MNQNNWYEVKVKYVRQLEDGRLKRVTEPYLLDAVSFTDAEARIYESIGKDVKGEFHIESIKRQNISDIFLYEDSDTWYSGIMSYVSVDGDTGKEKKVRHKMFISAESVKQADERLKECLKDMVVTYEIKEIKETKVVDVIPYNPE
jgi:hypothetical protein